MSFTPPAVAGGWLFDGASHGYAVSSTVSSQRAGNASTLRRYSSFNDKRHGWQSREAGVYATDDGGHTWRRIYRTYAQRVLRLSASRGVISVGTEPSPCECAQRQLWTGDGGRTWHATRALGPDFAGAGRTLFSWSGDEVRRSVWPPFHFGDDRDVREPRRRPRARPRRNGCAADVRREELRQRRAGDDPPRRRLVDGDAACPVGTRARALPQRRVAEHRRADARLHRRRPEDGALAVDERRPVVASGVTGVRSACEPPAS